MVELFVPANVKQVSIGEVVHFGVRVSNSGSISSRRALPKDLADQMNIRLAWSACRWLLPQLHGRNAHQRR